jgi:tyrosyl-tRNA synthetase
MDVETRLDLIKRVGEEIVTEDELRALLETKAHPTAYDGFEPSGLAPVHFGIYRAINWVNNKMGGDLEKIRQVGEYFIEVWKASGIDMNNVEVLWASDAMNTNDYWKKVILVAKNTTLAQLMYPMMQTADIFHLEADICQLGMDQRRANILAREVGPKLGWWKPVIVSHHILMGLEGEKAPEGYDENAKIDSQISSKMSKSRPETCLYVHDSEETIAQKIQGAFCPERIVEGNPILEYCRYIIFRKLEVFRIERLPRYGGNVEVWDYNELETMFREGTIHPLDLKKAVAAALNAIISPIREHFEKNKRAAELYRVVQQEKITR